MLKFKEVEEQGKVQKRPSRVLLGESKNGKKGGSILFLSVPAPKVSPGGKQI